MTCCAEKREIFGGGQSASCLQMGRVEMRKKKEK
jgi:hypothetical protein